MQKPLTKRQKIIWQDNMEYFLTSSTFLHYPYFKNTEQKQIVLNKIKQIRQVLNVPILAYSIAINHLHLKFYLKSGCVMTQLKNILHSGISREYRKVYKVPYQKFWQSTRVYFITDEGMSWRISGYINGNLLKHREVSTFKELASNRFSSYWHFKEVYGEEEAQNAIRSVIDVPENGEGEIDLKKLNKVKTQKSVLIKGPLPWGA